jgi:ribosomal protein L13E
MQSESTIRIKSFQDFKEKEETEKNTNSTYSWNIQETPQQTLRTYVKWTQK